MCCFLDIRCKPLASLIIILNGLSGFVVQSKRTYLPISTSAPFTAGCCHIASSPDVCSPAVLVLRTYALWNCNKYVLWFLMSVSIVSIPSLSIYVTCLVDKLNNKIDCRLQAATLAQEALVAKAITILGIFYNPLPPPYSGCLLLLKNQTWQRYVPIVIFEISTSSIFLSLSIYLAFQRG
jgi:hypothetical protein